MKKIAFLTLLLLGIFFTTCKKEECKCPQQVGSYVFSNGNNHYPINSTSLPSYTASNDTIIIPLFRSVRIGMYNPPINSGQDYVRHETDDTEFRSFDFGMLYYSIAGFGFGPLPDNVQSAGSTVEKLRIDWLALEDYWTVLQRYTMEFLLPYDSNEINNELFILDSLQIKDTWYKNILSGPVHKSIQNGLDYSGPIPERFYYSIEYGIIKFDMSDGTAWEILNSE